jgi:hypothetical protein
VRVVDVGLDQDRVARGLVDLDVEAVGQQALELAAVEAGAPQTSVRRVGSSANSSSSQASTTSAQVEFGGP